MPRFISNKDGAVQNMNDIASDFACLKVSALKKASRISGEVNRITIGPESTVNEDQHEKSENIGNEQNSCNIRVQKKSIKRQSNKTSMLSGITFSMKKISLESENQRKEEVRKEIERHWRHMNENGKAIKEHMAISRFYMAEERERKSRENYACILAEEKLAEEEETRRRHEQQKEVEEYRKQMKEKEELTKKLVALESILQSKYHDVLILSETCKDSNSFAIMVSSYYEKLEEVQHNVNVIHEKTKAAEITGIDLIAIENVIHQIEEILSIFQSEIQRINAQYEANLASVETKQSYVQHEGLANEEKEESSTTETTIPATIVSDQNIVNNAPSNTEQYSDQQQVIENIVSSNTPETAPTEVNVENCISLTDQDKDNLYKYVDKESLQIYIKSQQFLECYMKDCSDFLQSTSTKKFRFECQKAINIPVNAISGINEQHLRDKYDKLRSLLTGDSLPNGNQWILEGATFCKMILAKKIVNQGETLVSSKPKMAFPIAAIIVALWNDFSSFGDLLLSHFHKACPFIVPVFMPKMVDQTNEDYYKSMGYKYAEDGTVEKQDKYLKRMSGLMRLYASVTVTSQRKGIDKSHPHGLQHAWRWLAAVLNIEPRTEITDLSATLLLDMLEVAGNALWTAYPKQFRKLLILLSDEYYPRMQNVGCIGGGPLVRLEEFLRNSLAKGFIPSPEGQLPRNFW